MSEQTVTINGVIYDKHTGMPVGKDTSVVSAASAKPRSAQHAHTVHHHTQKSTTLNRRYVKPIAKKTAATAQSVKVQSTTTPAVSEHKITHFAKNTSADTVHVRTTPKTIKDQPATVHPMVQRVAAARAESSALVPKPSHIIKQEAIEKSLRESVPASHRKRDKAHKHSAKAARGRRLQLVTAGVALFLVAGYFTYLNMPNLSVRVAAAQAGIAASYPSYRPSGYSLAGPVAFNDGQVSMKFALNGTNQGFTLTQVKSGWDSAAVQSNYVIPAAGSEYDVTQASGLTIYTYGKNAAWVNGSILYTIQGDANLTPDQIQRIATSL